MNLSANVSYCTRIPILFKQCKARHLIRVTCDRSVWSWVSLVVSLPRSAPQYRVRVCHVYQDLGFILFIRT